MLEQSQVKALSDKWHICQLENVNTKVRWNVVLKIDQPASLPT